MNIDIKDMITLSNNQKYVVVSKINYDEEIYYYIANVNDNSDIKFLREKIENNSLVEVKDKDLISIILPLFLEKTREALAEIIVDIQETDN